jgi:hypothetical protein
MYWMDIYGFLMLVTPFTGDKAFRVRHAVVTAAIQRMEQLAGSSEGFRKQLLGGCVCQGKEKAMIRSLAILTATAALTLTAQAQQTGYSGRGYHTAGGVDTGYGYRAHEHHAYLDRRRALLGPRYSYLGGLRARYHKHGPYLGERRAYREGAGARGINGGY